MYHIEDHITKIEYDGLTVKKLISKKGCETVLISLEKGYNIPDHGSPRDTLLIMLEGIIQFRIKGQDHKMEKFQSFNFPSKDIHSVLAVENAKFLIIR